MDRIKMYGSRYRIISGRMINDIVANYRVFLFLIIFIAGLLGGTIIIGRGGALSENISALIDSYKNVRIAQSFTSNLMNSLFTAVVFLAITAFLAFSSIGAPFVAVVPLIRGAGMGMICGYLYCSYKLTGLGYCLLLIYPGAVISTLAFLVSCAECYTMSKAIMQVSFSSKKSADQPSVKSFINHQGILLCISAGGALVDAAMTAIFSSFFTFT